jgi:hypothetical protein
VGGYTWATDFTSLQKWRSGNRPVDLQGIFKAVRRIVKAKAGFELPEDAQFEIVWGARPWSSAHTTNFGTLTYTVRVQLPHGASRYLIAQNDAFWQAKHNIARTVDNLWPDHHRGYDAATV